MSLQEDTVSADRKERIIFDPSAWRKKDKSGKKTSAITSRQNFDNEKFTRNEKEKVDEGTIQPSGDSKVDSAGPTQSDTISKEKHKKSNNPQIEFVSGTAQPAGSASTAIGSASATGRKIAEALMHKNPKFKDYLKKKEEQKAASCQEEVQIEEGIAGAVSGAVLGAMAGGPLGAVAGGYLGHKVQQGANASKAVKKKVVKEEETDMSKKTYTQFVEQLLEYTPGPGGVTRVQGRSYGANYDAGEDEDDKPAAKPAGEKRGRGRPAGSKSGANQKVTKGKSYGGIATHTLSLPNSK